MSELMNVLAGREDLRWRLLTTVSTLALDRLRLWGVGRVEAADDDSDHPNCLDRTWRSVRTDG